MSWVRDAVLALRGIILMVERFERLSEQLKALADASADQDRRLNRMEAKFELLERMAVPRHSLPGKSLR
jgi:hypothetical protein